MAEGIIHRVGILGGGQLARMLAAAGTRLGIACRCLDPSPEACAGAVSELVRGPFDDEAALRELLGAGPERVDAITCEFESVPLGALRWLEHHAPARPGSQSFAVGRNRLEEKTAFARAGFATAAFERVAHPSHFAAALRSMGRSALLKRVEGGYDGYGQRLVRGDGSARDRHDALARAWDQLGRAECILEAFVPFQRELSIIGCRGVDGTFVSWPIIENIHHDGILRASIAPAPEIAEPTAQLLREGLERLMTQLGHVGVLAVELFDVPGSLPMANEMAPRVHNTGHWTIEGSSVSQFENHMRAVVARPLVVPSMACSSAVMVNILGHWPRPGVLEAFQGLALHRYGKAERGRRKIGHATGLCASAGEAPLLRDRLLEALGPTPPIG